MRWDVLLISDSMIRELRVGAWKHSLKRPPLRIFSLWICSFDKQKEYYDNPLCRQVSYFFFNLLKCAWYSSEFYFDCYWIESMVWLYDWILKYEVKSVFLLILVCIALIKGCVTAWVSFINFILLRYVFFYCKFRRGLLRIK